MWLDNWNLINENRVLGCSDIIVKIRYRKQENHGTVTVTPEHLLHIQLHEPLTAIAPGQAAAFYKDDLLLGGLYSKSDNNYPTARNNCAEQSLIHAET